MCTSNSLLVLEVAKPNQTNKRKQMEDTYWAKEGEKHLSPRKCWLQGFTLQKHLSIISVTKKKIPWKRKLKLNHSTYDYRIQLIIDHKYRQELAVGYMTSTVKRDNYMHVVCVSTCAQLTGPLLHSSEIFVMKQCCLSWLSLLISIKTIHI